MGTRMTGNVNRLEGGARYDGQLVIPALNATTLASVAGELLPEALPPTALGTLTLRTRVGYAPDAGSLELTELSARAAEVDLSGTLRGTNLAGAPTWAGRIEVSQFNPATLLARFDHPVPARAAPTTLPRARAAADIEINGTRGVFRNLNLLLDDSTITGELTATFAEPAEYGFRLAIDRLDADRYMPPATEAPAGAAPAAADIALPTEPLRTMKLDGALTVGQLAIAGLRMSTVATTLAVGEGLGVVDSARASLYGGNFEGRLELDTRGEATRLALTGAATTIQLEPLLTDLYGEANMTGAGSFDLSLSGLGEQLSNVLDSSEGRVAFSLRDGEFRGFNLGRAMCSAYNSTQKLPRPAAAAEITRFSLLRGSSTVTEGIARTRDLEATTAFLAVTGQGQSDLVSREINYNLVARMTGSIGINGCESMDPLIGDSIPVRATGTITEPDIQPDYGEIVRQRVRGEVQDRLRERLQNLGR
jgi:AsmA protein